MVTTPVFEHLFNIGQGLKSFDTSGNHRHSVLSGNPVWVDGRKGKAIQLDGTDDAFVAPVTENVNEDFTIAFWVQNWVPGSGGAGLGILALQTASDIHATNNSLIIYKDISTGEIKVACYDTDAILEGTLESGSTASSGFMCVRKTGLTVSFFLNGAFVDEITITELNNFDWVLVGLTAYNYTKADWIDKIRYWDSALSDEEIEYWYAKDKPRWADSCVLWLRGDEQNGAVVADASPQGNDGTLNATLNDGTITGATWAVDEEKGKCLSFDGVNDYVRCPMTSGLTNITLCCWANFSNVQNTNSALVALDDEWSATGGIRLEFQPNSNSIRPRFRNASGGTTEKATSAYTLLFDGWHFFAATYDGSTIKFFVDGAKFSENVWGETLAYGSSLLNICKGYNSVYYASGNVNNTRIYNRALSDAEIAALYNRTSEVSEGCVAKWLLNEGSGLTAYDSHNRFPLKRGQALNLKGAGEYVSAPALAQMSNWTLCVHLKPFGLQVPNSAVITDRYASGNINFALKFAGGANPNLVMQSAYYVSSTWYESSSFTIIDGEYVFVVATYDMIALKNYINGELYNSKPSTTKSLSGNNSTRIGTRWDTSTDSFVGIIDEAMIFNLALSATEIKRVYEADGLLDFIPMKLQKASLNVKVGSVCSEWDSWDSLTATLKRKHRSFGKKKVVSFTVIEKVADVPWLDSLAYILEDKKDSGTPVDLYIRHERKTKAEGTCVINTLKVRYDSPLTTRYIDVEVQLQ